MIGLRDVRSRKRRRELRLLAYLKFGNLSNGCAIIRRREDLAI